MKFYRQEIEAWGMFHDFWMNNQLNLPVYVVKYEDLLENP
jgi:hypothetical protein